MYIVKTQIESDNADDFIKKLSEDRSGAIVNIKREPITCDATGKVVGYHYTAYIESCEM